MKLGVSYNLFDAEEHLESSIKQIRGSVDFISVVCHGPSSQQTLERANSSPALQVETGKII